MFDFYAFQWIKLNVNYVMNLVVRKNWYYVVILIMFCHQLQGHISMMTGCYKFKFCSVYFFFFAFFFWWKYNVLISLFFWCIMYKCWYFVYFFTVGNIFAPNLKSQCVLFWFNVIVRFLFLFCESCSNFSCGSGTYKKSIYQ